MSRHIKRTSPLPSKRRGNECSPRASTASILDIDHVADHPEPTDVTVLAAAEAKRYFGTERPSRADVEQAEDFWEDIGRGEAVCVVLYSGDRPSELSHESGQP
jgi:hypothetical protein